jgi:hypothetical protein
LCLPRRIKGDHQMVTSKSTEQTAEKTTPQQVIDTVAEKIDVFGLEIGEQVHTLLRETNSRYLTVRDTSGQLILRIPLTIVLAAGISFIMFVPIRRVVLLAIAALFARVYFSVEDADDTWERR